MRMADWKCQSGYTLRPSLSTTALHPVLGFLLVAMSDTMLYYLSAAALFLFCFLCRQYSFIPNRKHHYQGSSAIQKSVHMCECWPTPSRTTMWRSSILFIPWLRQEILFHCCLYQANWSVSFQGLFCLHVVFWCKSEYWDYRCMLLSLASRETTSDFYACMANIYNRVISL